MCFGYDTTVVYRKNLVVNKVDENGNDLSGATFTLTDANGNVIEPSSICRCTCP